MWQLMCALQSGQLHREPGEIIALQCWKHKQRRIIIEPAPSHPGNCNISCFRELMILSWSYNGGGRSGAGLQGAPPACHITADTHCLTTASQHQQLCKFRTNKTINTCLWKYNILIFFSSKRRPGRVTCSWYLLTTRSLITSISRSPSPRPSWSLHCPCDSKHFNSTGNLFFLLFMTRALSED